jgi:hypothetical protein
MTTVFSIGVHPRSLVHPLDSGWKDFITSSAANLDLGMGVDAMIYLTMFAKREHVDLGSWEPWSKACSHLWRPIGTSLLVICCGFAQLCVMRHLWE